MIEIIPNWHPILVHFTVALLLTATALLAWSLFRGRTTADQATVISGRLVLWIGLVAAVLTLAAGLQAYYSVGHDGPSHAAMTDHRNWGFGALAAFLVAGMLNWTRRKSNLPVRDVVLLLVSSGILLVTAYKGGELVYRYGLGVQSLPTVTGDGHDHDHGDGAAKKHDDNAATEHDCGDGAAQEHDDAGAKEHDHGDVKEGKDAAEKQGHDHPDAVRSDPGLVADALYTALREGDEAAVEKILAEDVLILEGGHAQTSRADYMGGHMKSDMAFLPNVNSATLDRKVAQAGDLAWVITHSRTQGSYRDKEIDELSREMLVMKHDGHNWRVTLIHWGEK
ncbi:DUF4440 domain-containing protein [Kordiimonas aquimaris]|uniref:DUF4440 domain-containing protein n=1 Tax=Kordiimonas aquimaris TaxID=707591 RepID=UPI0021D21C9C|nr:DUF4440 domain-containing protein [Kordiimonas aquimaris]